MISRQFFIFVSIGVLSAVIDIATLNALMSIGFQYGWATSFGFVSGLVVNYICHSCITFDAEFSFRNMFKFSLVVILNYTITMLFVYCGESSYENPLAGKIMSLPVVAINGFLLSKYWTFK